MVSIRECGVTTVHFDRPIVSTRIVARLQAANLSNSSDASPELLPMNPTISMPRHNGGASTFGGMPRQGDSLRMPRFFKRLDTICSSCALLTCSQDLQVPSDGLRARRLGDDQPPHRAKEGLQEHSTSQIHQEHISPSRSVVHIPFILLHGPDGHRMGRGNSSFSRRSDSAHAHLRVCPSYILQPLGCNYGILLGGTSTGAKRWTKPRAVHTTRP